MKDREKLELMCFYGILKNSLSPGDTLDSSEEEYSAWLDRSSQIPESPGFSRFPSATIVREGQNIKVFQTGPNRVWAVLLDFVIPRILGKEFHNLRQVEEEVANFSKTRRTTYTMTEAEELGVVSPFPILSRNDPDPKSTAYAPGRGRIVQFLIIGLSQKQLQEEDFSELDGLPIVPMSGTTLLRGGEGPFCQIIFYVPQFAMDEDRDLITNLLGRVQKHKWRKKKGVEIVEITVLDCP